MVKNNQIVKELIGKKITNAEVKGIDKKYDDKPYLFLTMDTGEVFKIIASYGMYTGKSDDEYPRFINIENGNKIKRW
ncbi:MAG: hypothetical protein AABW67_03165 [Nanoarchaeota archaeon]